MRTAIVRTPGGPDAIEFIDTEIPTPGPHQLLIRVEGAAVNPVDVQTRSGVYHALGFVSSPFVGLGWDVAGTVEQIGSDVQGFAPGDRVAALSAGVDRPAGAYADALVVDARDAATIPPSLTTVLASTVPLGALTAARALDLAGPGRERTLLITGAGGSVGRFAVELAVLGGWTVLGLARAQDRESVEQAGADVVAELPAQGSVGAVIDTASIGADALATVRDGGVYVGLVPGSEPDAERDITVSTFMIEPDGARLATLLEAAANGQLTPRIAATLPLTEASEAHARLAAGGVRGRLVLIP